MQRSEHELRVAHPRCPFCHEAVVPSDAKAACTSCMGWQHEGCWAEAGGRCCACGLDEVEVVPEADSAALVESPLDVFIAYVLIVACMLLGGLAVGGAVTIAFWTMAGPGLAALAGLVAGIFGGLLGAFVGANTASARWRRIQEKAVLGVK